MTEKTVESGDGLFWVDRGIDASDDHLAFGGHEMGLAHEFRRIIEESPEDSLVVVVGAHVGTWAVRFAQLRTVVAYEANPSTFRVLRQNMHLNALQDSMVLVPRPVWSESGLSLNFLDAQGKESGGSTRMVEGKSTAHQTTSLDDDLATLVAYQQKPVGFVLIDVEGAEAHVLTGAKALLARDKPVLAVEVHVAHPGVDPLLVEQLIAILTEAGYAWKIEQTHAEYHWFCWPQEVPAEHAPIEVEILTFD